jgi:truncated hemoglobin YjbI
MSGPPTLYEWVNGRPAIAQVIDCFYDRVEHDDLLSPLFPGGVSVTHREREARTPAASVRRHASTRTERTFLPDRSECFPR